MNDTKAITYADLISCVARFDSRRRRHESERLAASARAALSLDGGPRRKPGRFRAAPAPFHAPATAAGVPETAREGAAVALAGWKARRRKTGRGVAA